MIDATILLKMYAKLRMQRLGAQDPVELQRRQLLRLVGQATDTFFGRDHGFGSIDTVEEFQKRVPLRRYEDFWTRYWQPTFPVLSDVTWPGTIPYFAVTSGTTSGTTKYIPFTRKMNQSNIRGCADLLVHHVVNRPRGRLLAGTSFMLGGATDLSELAPGIWCGDLSGIAAKVMPFWARCRYFPPRTMEAIADWEEKIAALAPMALERDIRAIAGVPSWLLVFFERLRTLRPDWDGRLATLWPDLDLIIHGGVNFAPYRPLFRNLLAGSNAETREIYAASEGVIAAADRADGEGLRLSVDTCLFYEFVPVEELDAPQPTRHWLATVEKDVNYALVLSSCAGVWAYVIGDTVRFVDRQPPRILITGRTTYTLSAFGEHLIDEEIEKAVAMAAEAIDAGVTDYAVGAIYPNNGNAIGGHLFVIECAETAPGALATERFTAILDQVLSSLNDDYRTHRTGDISMRTPQAHMVAPGTFAAWMKRRGQLGGQHKVPRIINDEDLFSDLLRFTGYR